MKGQLLHTMSRRSGVLRVAVNTPHCFPITNGSDVPRNGRVAFWVGEGEVAEFERCEVVKPEFQFSWQ